MRSDRLLELAAHLKSDRRGHKVFDFFIVSRGLRDEGRHGCGGAGCALGELPVIWPKAWDFVRSSYADLRRDNPDYHVMLKAQKDRAPEDIRASFEGAEEWFDLTNSEVRALFCANTDLEDSPIETLPQDATAGQVADRFIAFVKWREDQADEGGSATPR